MTENDRNVRTLIVCFVLALAVLVPLRMTQGGSVLMMREAEVLGETEDMNGDNQMELIYSDEISEEVDEVILPDAEVSVIEETE